MSNLEVAKLNNSKYGYLVFSTSYTNSILDVESVSNDLRESKCAPGALLFDLLLVNGNAFNRFVEAYYDGEKIDPKTYNIVEIVDKSITDKSQKFYKNNSRLLDNSILTYSEKRKIMMS